MLVCVDVDYRGDKALAACVLFHAWTDGASARELVRTIEKVEPYVPGQFYKRELPCLLTVLAEVTELVEAILVDGYVWLQDEQTPGLGGHLYEVLERTVPVIGVAKTRFASAGAARAVKRGDSDKPLFVTAAGFDADEAARLVQQMHGPYRLPTLLKRVDHLCRNS
jgi:deoxyribonuclease V